ncbi:MAG: hypothetical protein ABR592_01550 [Nitriliruptorales bacterium]
MARGRAYRRGLPGALEHRRPTATLADEPHDPSQQAEHRSAATTLDRHRQELTRDRQFGLTLALGR